MHDLPHYIRTYDNDLDAELCQRLISSFTALQRFQNVNGRGVRAGLEDSACALDRYNADVGLHIPIPNSPLTSDLVMKRYRPGGLEKFQLHFDAVNHVAHRYLVLMWYLNDVAVGGETRFPQIGSVIAARAGRLLVFPPYWMYQHEGAPPSSGDKYILSTYLLFKQPQAS